jgi:phosphoenolpyruvate synthase/pyruvate phosphate dikinase
VVKPAHSPSVSLDVLPFLEVVHLQRQDVSSTGVLSSSLFAFHERGLPTPQAWVLPASAMMKIAQDNHLFQVLELEFSVLDTSNHQQMLSFSQDIAHHIKNMVLPESIARSFRRLYDNWIDHQFIAVRPSLVGTKDQPEHLSTLNVRGEANIIESLFETWARLYLPEFLPQRLEEWKQDIRVPAAFIFQVMVNAESSGVGIFTPATAKRPANITVFSQWGVTPDTQSLFRQGDWFEIDPQHWEVKQRHIGVKQKEWTRRLDELHQQPVQHKLQSHPSLTTQGAVALAKMVHSAHKGHVGAYIVDWAAVRDSAYILDVRPFHYRPQDSGSVYFLPTAEQLKAVLPKLSTPRTYTGPTATKLFVSVGKPDQVKAQVAGADGVGLLRAEWAYQQLPDHPFHLFKTGKTEQIRTHITELLLNVAQFHNPDFPILFRSQNFTTNELAEFKHGKEYEPSEVNPYLGYRGAVRIIHDYTLFDIELDALQDAHLEGVQNLGLLIPFVRNHSELAIILHHFSKPEFATQRFLQLWMQGNTPENILDIEHYCMPGLAGISLNIQSIHALLHGVDPDNSDVFQLYPVHHKGIYQHLKSARQKTHAHHIKLVLQLEQFDQKLIEFASELGYDGVTVRAKDVHRARQVIIETEHQHILG